MAHRHLRLPQGRSVTSYRGPVASPENPQAHGGVCFVDRCRCGATRKTNSNGGALERGPWVAPREDREDAHYRCDL